MAGQDVSDPDGVPDTVATATKYQTWTLDVQGNWDSVTTFNGSTTTTETRAHNMQNQIKTYNGTPVSWYDPNGNQTTDQTTGKTWVYDAWDRLVQEEKGTAYFFSWNRNGTSLKLG